MQYSSAWEANSSSAGQEIPRISCKQNFHYRSYNSPQLVPILSQISPLHAFPNQSFENPYLQYLPSTPRTSK